MKATKNADGTWTFENIKIGLKNFAGKGGQYNKDGDRNFHIFFEGADDIAHELENEKGKFGDSWRIKWTKPDEEGNTTAHLECNIKLGGRFRPPTIWIIPSNDYSNKIEITEENASLLDTCDWITIPDNSVDVTIRPYDWTWSDGDRHGRKAMVQELYIVKVVSNLQNKWKLNDTQENYNANDDVPFDID